MGAEPHKIEGGYDKILGNRQESLAIWEISSSLTEGKYEIVLCSGNHRSSLRKFVMFDMQSAYTSIIFFKHQREFLNAVNVAHLCFYPSRIILEGDQGRYKKPGPPGGNFTE
jgi:hypothetical protein